MWRSPTWTTPPSIDGDRARIAVLASGSGTNFDVIRAAIADGILHAEIVQLVCNVPGAGALALARTHGVPHTLIEHTLFDTRAAFDAAVVECLSAHEAEWVVMAGWMRIVTPAFIAAYPDRILNIHPSLLPSFKGMHAVRQALEAKVKIAGCTVHIVREDVDDGPIIAQAAVPVLPHDDEAALHARIQEGEHAIYPLAIAQAIMDARRADPND